MAKILVIDDDEQLRVMLLQLLTSAGHAVVTAHDGAAGLKQLRAHPTDLVITDILMPNQDGIETVIALRREYPHLPVIAMSGDFARSVLWLKTARLLGARCTLPKPFTLTQLKQAIAEVLAAHPY